MRILIILLTLLLAPCCGSDSRYSSPTAPIGDSVRLEAIFPNNATASQVNGSVKITAIVSLSRESEEKWRGGEIVLYVAFNRTVVDTVATDPTNHSITASVPASALKAGRNSVFVVYQPDYNQTNSIDFSVY
jgi:hypothetical protein